MQRRSDGTVKYTLVPNARASALAVRDDPILRPKVAAPDRRPSSLWRATYDVALASMWDAVAEVMSDTVGRDNNLGWNPQVLEAEFLKHVRGSSSSARRSTPSTVGHDQKHATRDVDDKQDAD